MYGQGFIIRFGHWRSDDDDYVCEQKFLLFNNINALHIMLLCILRFPF